MKFIDATISKIKKGDYVCYISPRMPYLKFFGLVRILNGQKVVYSKNCIQVNCTPYYHFKPQKPTRFFRSEISRLGKIQKLVD